MKLFFRVTVHTNIKHLTQTYIMKTCICWETFLNYGRTLKHYRRNPFISHNFYPRMKWMICNVCEITTKDQKLIDISRAKEHRSTPDWQRFHFTSNQRNALSVFIPRNTPPHIMFCLISMDNSHVHQQRRTKILKKYPFSVSITHNFTCNIFNCLSSGTNATWELLLTSAIKACQARKTISLNQH
jgi:hypothetical protein